MTDLVLALDPGADVAGAAWQVDAVRHNWSGSVRVVACAMDEDARSALAALNIDEIVLADRIECEAASGDGTRARLADTVRSVDRLRKVCGAAARSDARHTVYLRNGCHALSAERLRQLVADMSRRGKSVAARGRGLGDYAHDTPVGSFDAAFFVFDNEAARAASLWNFDLVDGLPHKVGLAGVLALRALGCLGAGRCWRYAAGDSASDQPYQWDEEHAFLRIDGAHLPNDLGARLTAWHYRSQGLTKGPAIEALFDRYDSSEAPVRELERIQARLALFRRRVPAAAADAGDVIAMLRESDDYESATPVGRARRLVRAHAGWWARTARTALKNRVVRDWVYRYRYGDMVWPNRLDAVYVKAFSGMHSPSDLGHLPLDEPAAY